MPPTPVQSESAEATLIPLKQSKYGSHWVVLARRWEDFGKLGQYERPDGQKWYKPLESDKQVRVWTDDFSNLLQVFHWTY